MLKSIQKSVLLLVVLLFVGIQFADAQKRVTLKDLNTYTTLQELADIGKHPLRDTLVTFTAILNSYPKNSGLASFNAGTGVIGRVHVYVTDTTAASLGRDGMGMQIVQDATTGTFSVIESLPIGSIVDVTGKLTFFNVTVAGVPLPLNGQFSVTAIEDVSEKVSTANGDLDRYYALLAPVVINPSDLNEVNGSGKVQMKLEAYPKYAHSYVKFENTTVQFSQGAIARPNYAVRSGSDAALVYSNDVSLRYRNDRIAYREGYNRRQGDDGDFTPPPAGALINLSGFLSLNNFDVFESVEPSSVIFKIAPFDDGIVWVGGVKKQNGVDNFTWPNDLTIIGYPPTFENFTISSLTPNPTDQVSVSIKVLPSGEATTLTKVEMVYTLNGTDQTPVALTATDGTYNYTFPTFALDDVVTFNIVATDSDDLVGTYGPTTFLVVNTVGTIEKLQRTEGDVKGSSPFKGKGVLALNITATVMADSLDGFVLVQSSSNAWSGIFLDARENKAVNALRKGDVVKLTAGEVLEDFDNTYLSKVELTKTGENSNYMDLAPMLLTQDITGSSNTGEAYEGMLIRFMDVKILNNNMDTGDFGEFGVGSRQGGTVEADTLSETQGLRVDDFNLSGSGLLVFNTGVSNFPNYINENVKVGAVVESFTGALTQSFGNPKLKMRGTSDIVAADWSYPVRTIALVSPLNNTEVSVSSTATGNLAVEWTASVDYDGNEVNYMFVLANSSNEVKYTANASNGGKGLTLNIPKVDVDALLATLGVELGATANLKWTIKMTDGVDTVQTSTYTGIVFTPVWFNIALKRDNGVSVDEFGGKTFTFELNQNYPNPFNPSTEISYSIPAASKVQLSVYNILGQQVSTLVNRLETPGNYTVRFDASKLSSGMYFYRLEAGSNVSVKKMLLVK